MRTILTIGPVSPIAGVPESDFLATCQRLWARFVAWRLRQKTRRALGALSDGMLHDIGVHRCEIDSLVAGNDNTRIRSLRQG
jgi:uncharacterized protein YjiS (DUF1127 family)